MREKEEERGGEREGRRMRGKEKEGGMKNGSWERSSWERPFNRHICNKHDRKSFPAKCCNCLVMADGFWLSLLRPSVCCAGNDYINLEGEGLNFSPLLSQQQTNTDRFVFKK